MAATPVELIRLASGYLGEKGVETPRLDAEVLLAHCLRVPRIQLYLDFDKPLETSEVDGYRALVRRRARREPLAYITGVREFWSLSLCVDRRVLVPRPETERLVEEALARVKGQACGRLADLGTGAGAIAVALLTELPGWTAVGVDASPAALAVATENAARLGLSERLSLREGNLTAPLEGESFDLIVSNPPYVPSGEVAGLAPEVAGHEPHEALDGGADGLDVLRRIAAEAPESLRSGGWLALEFGISQAEAVRGLLDAAGLEEVSLFGDYAGIPRVAVARRH